MKGFRTIFLVSVKFHSILSGHILNLQLEQGRHPYFEGGCKRIEQLVFMQGTNLCYVMMLLFLEVFRASFNFI